MSQNTSHAVMSQRHEAHDSLDFFPTPAWATRAFCEFLLSMGQPIGASLVWEPACGQGDMARPLGEYFAEVIASDVHDYGFGEVHDFLQPHSNSQPIDWIITNPPFRLGQQFIERALLDARSGVAMLVRTAFLESADRHAKLFSQNPPSDILQFVEPVPMFKGRLDRRGSTATAYCWLVWKRGLDGHFSHSSTTFHWLPPCRKRLERDSDYPKEEAQ